MPFSAKGEHCHGGGGAGGVAGEAHDDLVVALALALWLARRVPRPAAWAVPIPLDSGRGDVFADGMCKPGQKVGAQGHGAKEDAAWLVWG